MPFPRLRIFKKKPKQTDQTQNTQTGQRLNKQPDLLRDEQMGPPRDEQTDPPGNEQGYLQQGGGSNVELALERDDIVPPAPTRSTEEYIDLDIAQNLFGGRSTHHPANSRNTTARYNTSSSWNAAITNSNNTADNPRTYNQAKHNEFRHSEFSGPIRFGDNFYHSPLPVPPIDARTCAYLEKLVHKIHWDTLSRQLFIIDQDKHRLAIPPFHRNKPENFWISKNIDYTQWELAKDSRALLLSTPPSYGTTELCSHIIDLAKDSQRNTSLLYFFSSTATKARRLTAFIHTLLHQIVCCSNVEKADTITATFLNVLLGGHLQQPTQNFREEDKLDTTIEKILGAADNVLIEALVAAIKKAEIQELAIIVDGLPEDIARLVIEHSMRAIQKVKALFTIDESPKYGEILGRMTCIEYDKERQECLRSLQHDDTRYDKISEEHCGSLEWLWNHPQYRHWSTSATSSLLYIEGKPGSGKSTLAKYFVNNLQRERSARFCTVAHYFYTFRGTVLESTHENMLRSVLQSMLEQDESAFFHFQKEFRDFRRRNHPKWPYESLKKVLSSFTIHPPTKPLYLILDAIDESMEDDRRSIIELLCNLCSEENLCNIKVFIASRPVAELKHRIQKYHHVIIMQDENKHDILRFADNFLNTDLKLTGEILGEATDYISKNAQGVFVWVSLVRSELLAYVETAYTNAEILHLLKGLPKELETFYTFMLDRLERGKQRDIRDGIRLFQFVLFALRPLTIVELRDALAVPDGHNLSYGNIQRIGDISRRIEHCGGNFLEIKVDGTVEFMHQTSRDFWIRNIRNTSSFTFWIDDEEAHKVITTTWVRYLMLCFTSPNMPDRFSKIENWSPKDFRDYAEYLNDWPLIEYILCYIKDHHDLGGRDEEVFQLVITLIRRLADKQASYFLRSFIDFRFGHNTHATPTHEHQDTSENIKYTTLNAAIEPKLPHVVKALLLTCTQDDHHAERKTPLIISAQKGLAGATRLLLDLNVDKDAQDASGRTALHHAVESGDEATVRLLVEQGVKKDVKDNNGVVALELAVKKFPYDTKGQMIHLHLDDNYLHCNLNNYYDLNNNYDDLNYIILHDNGNGVDIRDLPPIVRLLY